MWTGPKFQGIHCSTFEFSVSNINLMLPRRQFWCRMPFAKARFPLRKIFAKCEIFLAKNSLLVRTKISPVLCEKFLCEKQLNSQLSSHFACEIMIWPIRMQLMTHYRIAEMTESLVGKASNCFYSALAKTIFFRKDFAKIFHTEWKLKSQQISREIFR